MNKDKPIIEVGRDRSIPSKLLCMLVCAAVYFICCLPNILIAPIRELTAGIRPAMALSPFFGMIFGIWGALGAAIGNFGADLLNGANLKFALMTFPFQLLFGYLPYVLWYYIPERVKEEELLGEAAKQASEAVDSGVRADSGTAESRRQLRTFFNSFQQGGYFMILGDVYRKPSFPRMDSSRHVIRYFLIILTDVFMFVILESFLLYGYGVTDTVHNLVQSVFWNNLLFSVSLGMVFFTISALVREKALSLNETLIATFLILGIVSSAMVGITAYKEMQSQAQSTQELWSNVFIDMATVMIALLIIEIFILKQTEKNVSRPLQKLADMADAIVKEDNTLNTSVIRDECGPYLDDPTEVGRLAKSYDMMADALDKYTRNLKTITKEKERIGVELNIATQIQEDLLPSIFPAFPGRKGFGLYATMNPAKEVGGDFYDFFLIDEDHLVLDIADVSGKGVPAALFMVISKTLLKNNSKTGVRPSDILAQVNHMLCENNKAEMFCTCWLGILEISTGRMIAANAGHEYPAIRRADGEFELMHDKHGLPLAAFDGVRYRDYAFTLNKGDTLFLYTDGLPEATNLDNEQFGTDRMLKALNQVVACEHYKERIEDPNIVPKVLIEQAKKAVNEFVSDAPQFDDLTVLCLDYNGGEEGDYSVNLDAVEENLEAATKFVDDFLDEAKAPFKVKMQFELALEEAFINVCRYAYPLDTGKVTLRMEKQMEGNKVSDVSLSIIDHGVPFDPLAKPDPDTKGTVEEREIGGLGILLIRKTMDSVSYEFEQGSNILKMIKKLA